MNKAKILKKILQTERTMSEISERVDRCKFKYEELEKELKLFYADLHMPYTSSVNLLDLPFLEKLSGRNSKRDIFIMKEWNENLNSTLQSIADKHDLTRERVRQILEKWEDIGYPIREPKDRTEFRRKKEFESVHEEIVNAIESCYGTPEFSKWKKSFYKKANLWQRRYFKNILHTYWKEGKADPLLFVDVEKIKLKKRHYKILKMKKSGMQLKQISKKLGISEQLVAAAIRDLKQAHLLAHESITQVEAVSLSKEEVDKRLNKMRQKIIEGTPLSNLDQEGNVKYDIGSRNSTAMHFVRRHFLKPTFFRGSK
jgi:DNA-binding NarL/FixJ family response regulator